jgi:SMI1-KNR4 cell-wall
MPVQQPSLRAFLDANPNASVGGGATEEEIAAAERELAVTFPATFRSYLAEFGYLVFRSAEFYGLGVGVPEHLDLIRNTKAERTEFHPQIPPHLVPFMPNGCGDHYCIDLSARTDDPPVVFWDHELDTAQQPQRLADTFTSWLVHHTHEWA